MLTPDTLPVFVIPGLTLTTLLIQAFLIYCHRCNRLWEIFGLLPTAIYERTPSQPKHSIF